MGHARLFVGQLFECFVNARLAESVDFQSFDHFVLAVFAGHRETKHHVFRNAVPTL